MKDFAWILFKISTNSLLHFIIKLLNNVNLLKNYGFFCFQSDVSPDPDNSNQNTQKYCRSQAGRFETIRRFQLSSYAWCFSFIFYIKYKPFVNDSSILFIHDGRIHLIPTLDYRNSSARSNVCSYLTTDECHQWTSCCAAADDCCQRQLSLPPEVNNTCGRIWDGWSCWSDASPGTENLVSCPLFMPFFSPSSMGCILSPIDRFKYIMQKEISSISRLL